MLAQRIDLLLFGPSQTRIVLEVDGAANYTDDKNRPTPERYAQNG